MKKWIVCWLMTVWTASAVCAAEVKNDAPYKAFMVVEASTGMVLEAENPHMKHPLASVTKLMLAGVVMEKLESGAYHLTDMVPVSAASSKIGGSQVYLKQGETFSLEEMMKAVMVASANDAAYALAEFMAGTQDAFAEEMNKTARGLGMNESEFHTAHGLPPSEGQSEDVSTCHDLTILARHLLKYPKLLEWTGIRTEPFRDGTFIMHNHNKIIARMPGADGFKTGYYAKAGFNVVATAEKDGLRLIVTVLGSPAARIRDGVAIEKFKKYMARYAMARLAEKGKAVGEAVLLPHGEVKTIQAVAASDFSHPLLREKTAAVKTEIHLPAEIQGGVEAGQKLGEMVFVLAGTPLGQVELISPQSVREVGFFKKLFRRFGFG